MAGTAGSTIELRTTGSDTNGGAFNPASAGTDYSQQDAAQLSVTDGVTNGTTTVTSATGGFTTAMVGNYINIAGTCYEITARASSTSITVDRATGSGSGQTMKVGGAVASSGFVAKIIADCAITSFQVWQKAGTYTLASTSASVSTGRANLSTAGTATLFSRWTGYNTTRGDCSWNTGVVRPLLTWGAVNSASQILLAGGGFCIVANLDFSKGGSTSTASTGLSATGASVRVVNCRFTNFDGASITVSGNDCTAEFCEVTGSTAGGGAIVISNQRARAINCYAHDNTGHGFMASTNGVSFKACIADTCTGASSDGFNMAGFPCTLENCISYNNGRHGFNLSASPTATLINCYASTSGGYGFNTDAASPGVTMLNCAGYNNTSGNYNNTNLPDSGTNQNVWNFKALSAQGLVDPANGDFTPNTTAGGGALLRGNGYPGIFPGLSMLGYPNIGTAQHTATGGSVIIIEED